MAPRLDDEPADAGSASLLTPLESLLAEQTRLRPGFRLDRYELLTPIARGGMGDVWIARMRGKHGFEKLVALKTILPGRSEEPRSKRMFLDEARIASGIDHVNVARILDLGEQESVLYLVMEWVDGDSLGRLQSAVQRTGGHVAPGVALRAIADACGGLHVAHELRDREGAPLGVVHRDVSPQNILIGTDGVAKIIDFGIAKARHRVSGETTDGILRGKLAYMAPEQALGREIDRRADVYSLGAVLYALLAGRPPFKGPNDAATFAFVTSGLPPQPLPRHVPTPVAEVVFAALAPLEQRYATAADLKRAIEGAIVACGLETEREEVAAYVERHLGERVAARRVLIDRAIDALAASERSFLEADARATTPWAVSAPGVGAPSAVARGRGARFAARAAPVLLLVAVGVSALAIDRRRVPAAPADSAPKGSGETSAVEPVQAAAPAGEEELAAAPGSQAPVTTVHAGEPAKHAVPSRSKRTTSGECALPYVLDASGIRHYKRACFR